MELMIPADDPVRLLSAFVEGMDLSELYETYDRIRKNQASPRQMLKIMIYAAMNRLFSSRAIETACRRDINFMYLLEGMPAPDHATIAKIKEYTKKLHICGDRNSYSKTDSDATFMRLKEDAMRNGQLKPAYNLQHGADSQYITWVNISAKTTDVSTLIPFLKEMEQHLPFKYKEIVADAGYESEEAYVFLEQNGQISYIKPQNYEISKTRKYREDFSRRENMTYLEAEDAYLCTEGSIIETPKKQKWLCQC